MLPLTIVRVCISIFIQWVHRRIFFFSNYDIKFTIFLRLHFWIHIDSSIFEMALIWFEWSHPVRSRIHPVKFISKLYVCSYSEKTLFSVDFFAYAPRLAYEPLRCMAVITKFKWPTPNIYSNRTVTYYIVCLTQPVYSVIHEITITSSAVV